MMCSDVWPPFSCTNIIRHKLIFLAIFFTSWFSNRDRDQLVPFLTGRCLPAIWDIVYLYRLDSTATSSNNIKLWIFRPKETKDATNYETIWDKTFS